MTEHDPTRSTHVRVMGGMGERGGKEGVSGKGSCVIRRCLIIFYCPVWEAEVDKHDTTCSSHVRGEGLEWREEREKKREGGM